MIFFVISYFLVSNASATYLFNDNDEITADSNISPVVKAKFTGEENEFGTAIYGWASANVDFRTYGVYGRSNSSEGRGVFGVATATSGEAIGVMGKTFSDEGYGVYSHGNMHVTGNLTVDGAIPEYRNLALDAVITASSAYDSNSSADNVTDGYFNRLGQCEWVSAGEKAGAWIQLNWEYGDDMANAISVNEVWLFGRCNEYDQILDAWLDVQFPDGATDSIHIGMFPSGGAPKIVYLTKVEGNYIIGLKLRITKVARTTRNIGLAEMKCFYNPNRWTR